MANHPGGGRFRLRIVLGRLAVLGAVVPTAAGAAWQTLLSETGRRIEIDRSTIVNGENSTGASATVTSRFVFERPIVDPKTSSPYRFIEVVARYDCAARTYATTRRTYYKDEGDPLRAEEVKLPFDTPVRTGSPEDRIRREVCRPKPATPVVAEAAKLASRASDAALALRRENEALVARQVQKELAAVPGKPSVRATPSDDVVPAVPRPGATDPRPAAPRAAAPTNGKPERADGRARPRVEPATCSSGRQQSPIDVRETIAVDLEPIQFAYRPVPFRVADSARGLQMNVYGGGFGLLGKTYALSRIDFRRPAETSIAGKVFDMEAQLVHRSEDGKLAVVVVLLESGAENPVIQTALNNLPLERGGEVSPPGQSVDVERLLPDDRRYYAFMGSLTTPPCTEDVLWLVLKEPQPVSAEQQAIFARLYAPNARPVQATNGRIVKESR